LAVTAILAAYDRGRRQRLYRPQDLDRFVADAVWRVASGRLHGQQRHDLEHVVLEHVANRAGFFVESAATLHINALGHRDLHVRDAVPVPDWLEDPVGKPEAEDVQDRLLAHVVVDPEDPRFRERLAEDPIQLAGRPQIATEGLLDNDPGLAGTPGLRQVPGHGGERA